MQRAGQRAPDACTGTGTAASGTGRSASDAGAGTGAATDHTGSCAAADAEPAAGHEEKDVPAQDHPAGRRRYDPSENVPVDDVAFFHNVLDIGVTMFKKILLDLLELLLEFLTTLRTD